MWNNKPLFLASFCAAIAWTSVGNSSTADLGGETTLEKMLPLMSVEQKVGQLIQAEIKEISPQQVRRYAIGSVLNGGGSHPSGLKNASLEDWLELAEAYFKAGLTLSDGTHIAPIWGTDAVHGHNNVMGATLFPHNIGLGAAGNVELVESIGAATAREVKATGLDWIFAPTVAVAQDFRWGRTYESYHSDPDIVSALGGALVRGIESEGIAATAKHFVGDGATLSGIDQGNVIGSLDAIKSPHIDAYAGAFAADVPSVMASFNSLNGQKIHGSKALLTGLLRDELGFDGMVVSDWNGIGQVAGCTNKSCVQAFNAGVDMIMAPQDWRALQRNMVAQVANGDISMSRLNEAVLRVLSFKQRYGLINGVSPESRSSDSLRLAVGSDEHRTIARLAVRKSLVLLKNDGVLPLQGDSRVAVVGEGADNITMQSGGWSLTWQGRENNNDDFPGATSIRAGIRSALESMGGAVTMDPRDEAVDVAVVVFGEQPYAEGQGDRGTLVFRNGSYADLQLMRWYQEKEIPVVAVFISGRPMWVNREINSSDAFVAAWLPGSEGAGVADVLVGNAEGAPRHDFTGTLPFAWPMQEVNPMDDSLPVDVYAYTDGHGLDYSSNAPQSVATRLPETLVKKNIDEGAVVFRGGTQSPWMNYLGDPNNWVLPVSGSEVSGAGNEITVSSLDVRKQEDARSITWSGSGSFDSQFYWKTPNDRVVDLSAALEQGGAISLVLKMQTSPVGKVGVRMDCLWPCRGELDVTKLFKRLPTEQWVRLSFPLACFEEAGVDLSSVNAPFVLVSSREMSLAIYDLAVVPSPDADSLVDC